MQDFYLYYFSLFSGRKQTILSPQGDCNPSLKRKAGQPVVSMPGHLLRVLNLVPQVFVPYSANLTKRTTLVLRSTCYVFQEETLLDAKIPQLLVTQYCLSFPYKTRA